MPALDSVIQGGEFAAHMDILSRAIQAAERLLKQFRMAPATTLKKRFALIALNEVVRKCKSVEAMSRPEAWAGIPVVVRSAFESYADLRNCLNYGDDYANYMIWISLNHQLSYFQAIRSNPASPYAQSIEQRLRGKRPSQNVAGVIDETKLYMAELASELPAIFKDRKGKVIPRDIFKFELAGLQNEYNALYRRLSGGAHGRVSDIIDGIVAEQGYRWPPGPSDPPIAALDCLCAVLIESCRRAAKAYKKPTAPFAALERMRQELRRALYG